MKHPIIITSKNQIKKLFSKIEFRVNGTVIGEIETDWEHNPPKIEHILSDDGTESSITHIYCEPLC